MRFQLNLPSLHHFMFHWKNILSTFCVIAAFLTFEAAGEDWPVYQHDNYRSAKTAEQLPARSLETSWTWKSAHPPHPAWSGPAKWDAYAGIRGLKSMRNYDPVFHVIAAGNNVYFGSSVDDSVRCLDAETGNERWIYHTDGPIRIAPSYHDGRIFFGSDDGMVRCLDAENGLLVWSFRPKPLEKLILNNGKLIPFWPIRTGVLILDNTAYFAASLLPWKESYLCAIDATTGKLSTDKHFVKRIDNATFEGALLASDEHLVAPQGRVSPLIYNRANGKLLGGLKGGGGCFVMLTPDAGILHGPGNKTGWITDSNRSNRTTYATYPNANAMVVDGEKAFFLTNKSLAAMDRKNKNPLWGQENAFSHSLIKAGGTLFAGGTDTLAAFEALSGKMIWQSSIPGRVYGLAVANGALYASTDQGIVQSFRPTASSPLALSQTVEKESESLPPLKPIQTVKDDSLMSRWVFHQDAKEGKVIRNLAGKLPSNLIGPSKLARIDDKQALALDGSTSALIKGDLSDSEIPKKQFSVEAWVCIDEPLSWGGIVGAIQDNGTYEKGWLLGFVDQKFSFALNGQNGPDKLNYMKAGEDFLTGQWYHLAATYDGATMSLHVNGAIAATSTQQSGAIQYPPSAFYEIGAYHDKDEHYFSKGMVHEVRVYHRVLSVEEIRNHTREVDFPLPEPPAPVLELASGPTLQFISKSEAEISYETVQPSPTKLVLTGKNQESVIFLENQLKTEHRMVLSSLQHNRVYSFTVEAIGDDGTLTSTEEFECDNLFNFSMPRITALPQTASNLEVSRLAATLIEDTGIRQGIGLLIGSDDGRLAHSLAKQSQLRIIGLEKDTQKIASSRDMLTSLGSYGSRIAIHKSTASLPLPITPMFANLVVLHPTSSSEPALLIPLFKNVAQWLRPDGGVAYIPTPKGIEQEKAHLSPWFITLKKLASQHQLELKSGTEGMMMTRGPLEGSGEWSHQYGNASNAAFGGEKLSGVSKTEDLEVQWIGRPGPRAQPDRNGRKPAPLSTGGRLFVQGLNRIIALDAYNGYVLWAKELPRIQRFNMPRDSSNWSANRDFLFTAMDGECWKWDAQTGDLVNRFPVPPQANPDEPLDWSYLSPHRKRIIGSSVIQGSAFTNFWGGGGAGWYDAKSGEVTQKVCSENLFALDSNDGKLQWLYQGGLIVNSSITMADGKAWFVEARNPDIMAAKTRQLGGSLFWKDQYLVCLDLESGQTLWSSALNIIPGEVALYMAHGGGKLVLVASGSGSYHTYAFNDANGEMDWNVDVKWPQDHHGGHMARPAIVGNKVYVRPSALSLADGKILDIKMPGGGCGTYAATEKALFFRSGNVTMWDPSQGKTTSWNRLRPDCWLSTIPAAGLLLSPEGGGGCSCGSWMETSIVFAPKHQK